jgi:hypothetical protein
LSNAQLYKFSIDTKNQISFSKLSKIPTNRQPTIISNPKNNQQLYPAHSAALHYRPSLFVTNHLAYYTHL